MRAASWSAAKRPPLCLPKLSHPAGTLLPASAACAGFRLPDDYQAPALGRVRRPGSDTIEEISASQEEEADVAAYLEGLEEEEAEA